MNNNARQIQRVLLWTLLLNWLVAAIKLVAGWAYNHFALSSSGLESIFDGHSNLLGLVAIHFAYQPADADHHYGHYKYETIGSLVIAFSLAFAAFWLGKNIYSLYYDGGNTARFGLIPVLAIVTSMAISWYVARYERAQGEKLSSSLLLADAAHTYGDFLASSAVLFSIICSYFGLVWPDMLVGIGICGHLVILSLKIVRFNLPFLLDAAPQVDKKIFQQIPLAPEVVDIHHFRARGSHSRLYLDFHLTLSPQMSLEQAHQISQQVEEQLRILLLPKFLFVDITVRMEPVGQCQNYPNHD